MNSNKTKTNVTGTIKLILIFVALAVFAYLMILFFKGMGDLFDGKSGSSDDYSYSGKTYSYNSASHKCLVCGESANYQLGSYWYCYKHYQWAKAAADDMDKKGNGDWRDWGN